ncbi:hypothetical protein [Maribacter sp. 2307ULW6-5]|uniref:hypothetical protein n=1 Tax=Maribacter sp. 2307ULW6-5 TaxID=3386275 RepID=UPI0039BD1021
MENEEHDQRKTMEPNQKNKMRNDQYRKEKRANPFVRWVFIALAAATFLALLYALFAEPRLL